MMTKRLVWLTVVLLMIAGVFAATLTGLLVRKVPVVEFTLINGTKLAIDDLQGKPVLINFWATTCELCLREIPELVKLYDELNPHGLEIIGVAMPYDPPARVLEFSSRHGVSYPVALDIQGHITKAFGDVSLIPATFLITPDGHVVLHTTGVLDIAKVRRRIVGLLKVNET